jgi:hypothetical protein
MIHKKVVTVYAWASADFFPGEGKISGGGGKLDYLHEISENIYIIFLKIVS